MMASENFEQVLAAAQAGESLHPAWKKLVRTQFFVAVQDPADGGAYTLHLPQGARAIGMSEVRERLAGADGSLLVALPGADVVRMVPDGVGLAVVLSEQTFEIAASRVAWIRKSIEATLARAAEARAAAAPRVAPAPDPASASGPTAAGAAPQVAAAPQKTPPSTGRLPVLEPMPAGAYEDLVFVDEDPAPPAVPLLDRIGRKRALAYGVPLLAAAGLAGQALMRAMAERPRPAQALGGSSDGAAQDAGPVGVIRKGGAPLASQVWTSPDGGLTVAFPARPEEDTVRANTLERMGAVRMRQFSVVAHSETYKVQVLDLGAAPADPEAAMLRLQATLVGSDAVLTAPPMDLVLKGFPGRDIKAGPLLIRMAMVNATAYIASAEADASAPSMRRAGEFIGSLALNQ